MKKQSKIPKTAKKLAHRVLRDGEQSGHRHVAVSEDVELYDIGDGILAARMPTGTRVKHEEHRTVILPAGEKCIGPTTEYDHLLEEGREVLD